LGAGSAGRLWCAAGTFAFAQRRRRRAILEATPGIEVTVRTMVGRILAVLGGVSIIALMAALTAGLALMAPVGMWGLRFVQRRRGFRVTAFGELAAAVLTFAVAATLAVAAATMGGAWRGLPRDLASALDDAAKRPPPPPAIFKNMPTLQPQPLPPAAVKGAAVFGVIVGIEALCLLVGGVTWAGARLVVYGMRGPRPPPPVVEADA
jgi:hypothetical protein